jgi:hypothetical protein
MLKYKILIKLYVLICLLLCCVFGDKIQEVVVLCLLIALVLTHNAGFFTSTQLQASCRNFTFM